MSFGNDLCTMLMDETYAGVFELIMYHLFGAVLEECL